MPSALTILQAYQRQVADARGAGMAGLCEQARLGSTMRALAAVVERDFDPREDAALDVASA